MQVRIATIHFAPVEADRSPVGLGMFNLPAVAMGSEPYILTIEDMNQKERGNYPEGRSSKTRPLVVYAVKSMDIAQDIVNQWTTQGHMMDNDAHPGIWVVRDYVPVLNEAGLLEKDAEGHTQWQEASAEQKKAMWFADHEKAKLADRAYAVRLFDYWGGKVSDKPAMRQFISKACLAGAAQYGFSADWLSESQSTAAVKCPYCKKSIPAGVVYCPHKDCHEVVDVDAWAALERKKANALKAAESPAPIAPPVKMPGQPARA